MQDAMFSTLCEAKALNVGSALPSRPAVAPGGSRIRLAWGYTAQMKSTPAHASFRGPRLFWKTS